MWKRWRVGERQALSPQRAHIGWHPASVPDSVLLIKNISQYVQQIKGW